MGKTEAVEVLVEGGKATAAPPIGPTLGALKVNIGAVVSDINKKTEAYKGMKVPVKIIVDTETKAYNIEIGTPPVSQLIKKEAGIDKGSGTPNLLKVADIAIEQVIKIAKLKYDSMYKNSLKDAVKSVVGTCTALGVLIEGKKPAEIIDEINRGVYDKEIKEERTTADQDKIKRLQENTKALQSEAAKKRQEKEMEKMAKEGAAPEGEEKTEEAKGK